MKLLPNLLLGFTTVVLALVVSQYLFCPRFHFEEPSPFEGSRLFNPYEKILPEAWIKCNFHAHARVWNGLTNGKGTARDIHNAYRVLDYGVHCVSNYQEIDTTDSADIRFIPAYEHGYNLTKTHQLILGSRRVVWLDYLLPQTIDNKQNVLNKLRTQNALVVLNHPEIRHGYTRDDLAGLVGYDCMEVLNPAATSTREWDAALSAGKKVFITGNDDLHNVTERARLGRNCTFVNVPKNEGSRVLEALRSGQSYAVSVGKNQSLDSIPVLKSLTVRDQTVMVEMNKPAQEIEITGQNGRRLAIFRDTNRAEFRLLPSDHYARTTVKYENGTTLYLNPVFFTPPTGYVERTVSEDRQATILSRTFGVLICCLWFLMLIRLFTGYRIKLPHISGGTLSGLPSNKSR